MVVELGYMSFQGGALRMAALKGTDVRVLKDLKGTKQTSNAKNLSW